MVRDNRYTRTDTAYATYSIHVPRTRFPLFRKKKKKGERTKVFFSLVGHFLFITHRMIYMTFSRVCKHSKTKNLEKNKAFHENENYLVKT